MRRKRDKVRNWKRVINERDGSANERDNLKRVKQ